MAGISFTAEVREYLLTNYDPTKPLKYLADDIHKKFIPEIAARSLVAKIVEFLKEEEVYVEKGRGGNRTKGKQIRTSRRRTLESRAPTPNKYIDAAAARRRLG